MHQIADATQKYISEHKLAGLTGERMPTFNKQMRVQYRQYVMFRS